MCNENVRTLKARATGLHKLIISPAIPHPENDSIQPTQHQISQTHHHCIISRKYRWRKFSLEGILLMDCLL